MTRTRRRHLAMGLTLLAASCGSTCTPEPGRADRVVRAGLDAFALAAGPVQDAIIDGCITSEKLIATRAEAGAITVEAAREQLVPLRARCDVARTLLGKIAAAHNRAVDRVEAGDVEAAERELRALAEEWKQLKTWGSP